MQTGNVKDVRAIFTKVDVVVSTCTGGRRIGVYYGTGGEQRPALDEYLRNANDHVAADGVVRGSPSWPAGRPWTGCRRVVLPDS